MKELAARTIGNLRHIRDNIKLLLSPVSTNESATSEPSSPNESTPKHAGQQQSTRKNASPITPSSTASTPTPLKKSKRQAERLAARGKGAFSASQRKEEEDEKYYSAKTKKDGPPTAKRQRTGEKSNSADKISNPSQTESNEDEGSKVSQVVTPSPTQLSFTPAKEKAGADASKSKSSSSSKKKRPKSADKTGDTIVKSTEKGTEKTKNQLRKRRKLVYKAISGPGQPIHPYTLELISLVCNNSYCVVKNSSKSEKRPPQPHMVLDRPIRKKYTPETEPLKERLIRLQLRQRFAAASSIGMSPIEFARKLLGLWGGSLEQLYETTASAATNKTPSITKNREKNTMKRVVSLDKNNKSSSLPEANLLVDISKQQPQQQLLSQATQSRLLQDDFAALSENYRKAIESCGFDKSIGELEPRSIHPDAIIGGQHNIHQKLNESGTISNNPVDAINLYALDTNPLRTFPTKDQLNKNGNFHHNPVPTEFFEAATIFGESNARLERTKKLKQNKDRKKLRIEAAMASSSSSSTSPLTIDPLAPLINTCLVDSPSPDATPSSKQTSKKKTKVKRTPRKFLEDSSVPVLFENLRLSHEEDGEHLNALHCFVRDKLLEVYVIKGKFDDSSTEDSSTEHPSNIVGLRCTQCRNLDKPARGKGQNMTAFFPKSIAEIYRGVCTWQRIHFPACPHIPEDYKQEYRKLKEMDLTRGRKFHWIKSAYDLGLRNVDSERNGITYQPGSPYDINEVLKYRPQRPQSKKKKLSPPSQAVDKASSPAAFGRDDEQFDIFGTELDPNLKEPEKKDDMTTMATNGAFENRQLVNGNEFMGDH